MKFVDIHQQNNITLHLCQNHKNYNIFWGGKGYGVAQMVKESGKVCEGRGFKPWY